MSIKGRAGRQRCKFTGGDIGSDEKSIEAAGSDGAQTVLATLAASASYIAAPAAFRTAVPEANPALSLTAALAVTLPFNIILGIPLYERMAAALAG